LAGPAKQSQSAVRASGAPPRARREPLPLLKHPRSKRGHWQSETGTACSSGTGVSSQACLSWKGSERQALTHSWSSAQSRERGAGAAAGGCCAGAVGAQCSERGAGVLPSVAAMFFCSTTSHGHFRASCWLSLVAHLRCQLSRHTLLLHAAWHAWRCSQLACRLLHNCEHISA